MLRRLAAQDRIDLHLHTTRSDGRWTEEWQKIAPDASDASTALRLIREIYPPEKEALGVYVFEVEPVTG